MKQKTICFSFFSFFLIPLLYSADPKTTTLLKENNAIASDTDRIIQFYQLNEGEKWRDITQEVLDSSETSPDAKQAIRDNNRRIIVFTYPSDNLKIKGFLSYTSNPEVRPLLILFRWGNQNFALMNPGLGLANHGDYTVISSTLRGGVSEGKDEFGGADVDDMKNLIAFIPTLAAELNISLHPHCTFMLGPSRGGLEMFQTLAKYPELQTRITKIVALSSILDLHQQIQDRPYDMKPMFEHMFGLTESNKEQWIKQRDPLQTISKIKKSLPILIVQGTADPRINLKEGYRMRDALEKSGHDVSYLEVPHGNHTLSNTPQIMDVISKWLESEANCYPEEQKQHIKK